MGEPGLVGGRVELWDASILIRHPYLKAPMTTREYSDPAFPDIMSPGLSSSHQTPTSLILSPCPTYLHKAFRSIL